MSISYKKINCNICCLYTLNMHIYIKAHNAIHLLQVLRINDSLRTTVTPKKKQECFVKKGKQERHCFVFKFVSH